MSERNYTHNITWYNREAREGVSAEGISIRTPADWKPDFVEYELSINLPAFRQWLSDQIAAGGIDRDGWLNLDMVKRKPKQATAMPEFASTEAPAAVPDEDLPF